MQGGRPETVLRGVLTMDMSSLDKKKGGNQKEGVGDAGRGTKPSG